MTPLIIVGSILAGCLLLVGILEAWGGPIGDSPMLPGCLITAIVVFMMVALITGKISCIVN